MKIKINKRNLTQKQIDNIIEDENTINLTGKQSTNQRIRARRNARIENKIIRLITSPVFLILTVTIFILLVVIAKEVNASDTEQINDEYKYYNVTNGVDYDRKQRLEACERVYIANKEFVDNTYIHKNQDVVIRCATMMGLIGSFESGGFKSNMCINNNNCWGIKSRNTGKFMIFETRYQGQLYFAEKYLVGRGNSSFQGHKNRTVQEFVYAWSQTDRISYTNYVQGHYYRMYTDLEDLYFN